MIKDLHIVCLAQPYPPNYGGAVEMYYKLKALHAAGVKITLHIFLYGDYKPQEELSQFASKIYYYRRYTGIQAQLSLQPYTVKSRKNAELLRNLCSDNSPILFEGLHTCAFLGHPSLRKRYKIVRTHNIEHEFYRKLASYHPMSWKSVFFNIEAWKLERYEKVLRYANRILAISEADAEQLSHRYPNNDVRLLNCFFDDTLDNDIIETQPYILYHGNLSIAENIRVAEYLLYEIAPHVSYRLIMAGLNPVEGIVRKVMKVPNVELIPNPSKEQMDKLVAKAHINLLITFQNTGVKLKLLNSLYKGQGYVIANNDMIHGTKLGKLCTIANTAEEIIQSVNRLMKEKVSDELSHERRHTIRQLGYNRVDNIIN
jgi:hypothetical protein